MLSDGRGRARRRPLHRPRLAHRSEVPAGRSGLRRLVLPQRHLRHGRHRPPQRLRVRDHRGGAARQRQHQGADGRENRRGAGRRPARQDSGHPRTRLQAGDRRHARLADHPADQGTAEARGEDPGLRSGGHRKRQEDLRQRDVLQRRVQDRRGRGRAGHRHRVERVPRAQARAHQEAAAKAVDRRPAQRL